MRYKLRTPQLNQNQRMDCKVFIWRFKVIFLYAFFFNINFPKGAEYCSDQIEFQQCLLEFQ